LSRTATGSKTSGRSPQMVVRKRRDRLSSQQKPGRVHSNLTRAVAPAQPGTRQTGRQRARPRTARPTSSAATICP